MGLRSDRLADRLVRERAAVRLLTGCLLAGVVLIALAMRAGPPLVGEPYTPSAVVPTPVEEMTCPAASL